jgi:hypothetical protein
MAVWDIETYLSRSRAVDLTGIDWDAVARTPLPPEVVRVLCYMQDIEGHTLIYLRELLATRAVDDPEVAAFLACWLYEEAAHSRALARFLAAAGVQVEPRRRSDVTLRQRLESGVVAGVSRCWPEFVAVHMVWGAINELTTLTGYRRLAEVATHPVLSELLARIMRDESRHFLFYFQQAQRRLQRRPVARIARTLVERFWAPVGSGVQPAAETSFLAHYLFGDAAGRAAARKVDATIQTLPGFESVALLDAWLTRETTPAAAGAFAPIGRIQAEHSG